jgi:arabinofuranosyltransferase
MCLTLIARRKKLDIYAAIGAGIALNCAYTISIGGDYMMGRFWAVPFFAGIWLLLAVIPQTIRRDYLFAAIATLLTCYTIPKFVIDIRELCSTCIPVNGRIMDARMIFTRNELFPSLWPLKMRHEGQYKFGYDGKELAQKDPIPVTKLRYVGMNPYYAGARAIIIDENALADPLLARLPALTSNFFYVGHFKRKIPDGYEHALVTNSLDKMDRDLAQYYEKIRLLTRGDLWDSERLMTILRFNTGHYDYYKQRYLVRQK